MNDVGYAASCPIFFFFFSSRRRHTISTRDWSSDVCSSDLLAKREGELAKQKQAFASEQQTHRQTLERVKLIDQVVNNLQADPHAFMMRVGGPAILQRLIDQVVGDAGKKPEVKQAETVQQIVDERVRAYQQQMQASATEHQRQQQIEAQRTYIDRDLTAIVSDNAKYPFLNHEFGSGQAAKHLYNALVDRYRRTGQAPDPVKVAAEFETYLKKKAAKTASLLGVSVPSEQQDSSNGIAASHQAQSQGRPNAPSSGPIVRGREPKLPFVRRLR